MVEMITTRKIRLTRKEVLQMIKSYVKTLPINKSFDYYFNSCTENYDEIQLTIVWEE